MKERSYEQSISMKSLLRWYDVASDEFKVNGYTVMLFRYIVDRESNFCDYQFTSLS